MEENTSKATADRKEFENLHKIGKIIPEPIAVLKSDGEILFVNKKFKKAISQDNKTIIGKNLLRFLLDPAEKVENYLKSCSRTRQMLVGRLSFFDDSGTTLEFACEGAVFNPRQGNEVAEILIRLKKKDDSSRQFSILTDKIEQLNKEISIRKKAEKRNEDLYLQASEANRLKDEFLATVSLELRTPLNALLGWISMLRSGNIDRRSFEEALETMELMVNSQSEIIENLLDVSNMVTGKLNLRAEPFDLVSTTEKVLKTTKSMAENKSIELRAKLGARPIMISGDVERLQQVIWNLLTNAIKFTPTDGKVLVGLSVNKDVAEFTVSDTGKGISKDFLPFVFERFLKSDAEESKQYSGLGLGLSIVKYIVEMHGGSVEAFSEGRDQGAKFVMQIPINSG